MSYYQDLLAKAGYARARHTLPVDQTRPIYEQIAPETWLKDLRIGKIVGGGYAGCLTAWLEGRYQNDSRYVEILKEVGRTIKAHYPDRSWDLDGVIENPVALLGVKVGFFNDDPRTSFEDIVLILKASEPTQSPFSLP